MRGALAAMAAMLMALATWPVGATAQTLSEADALKSPACLAARERLEALMAEDKPDIVRLRAARQRGARACFRAEADAAEQQPARLERPRIVLPPPGTPVPVPAPPTVPAVPGVTAAPALAPAAQPAQVQRCDAGGCWDTQGQRLNRVGPQLANPQGQLCTQQGTVLSCP
ncbi:MAG TPA: hypothetical protein VMS38_03790 [Pseudorhodoferax sp.]|nr:hypothetical protein [Pseudorhodoferax sp.]